MAGTEISEKSMLMMAGRAVIAQAADASNISEVLVVLRTGRSNQRLCRRKIDVAVSEQMANRDVAMPEYPQILGAPSCNHLSGGHCLNQDRNKNQERPVHLVVNVLMNTLRILEWQRVKVVQRLVDSVTLK